MQIHFSLFIIVNISSLKVSCKLPRMTHFRSDSTPLPGLLTPSGVEWARSRLQVGVDSGEKWLRKGDFSQWKGRNRPHHGLQSEKNQNLWRAWGLRSESTPNVGVIPESKSRFSGVRPESKPESFSEVYAQGTRDCQNPAFAWDALSPLCLGKYSLVASLCASLSQSEVSFSYSLECLITFSEFRAMLTGIEHQLMSYLKCESEKNSSIWTERDILSASLPNPLTQNPSKLVRVKLLIPNSDMLFLKVFSTGK